MYTEYIFTNHYESADVNVMIWYESLFNTLYSEPSSQSIVKQTKCNIKMQI